MKLNCDLGESFGQWTMGHDEAIMPHIDMANIACGFHAGDPLVINNTLTLAKQHNVMIGAHPSYPDLVGFGRRSIKCQSDELIALLHYQIGAIDSMAKNHDLQLAYVKPHGALYNDMMADSAIFTTVLTALSQYHRSLKLMVLAGALSEESRALSHQFGVELLHEAFADRRYQDSGALTPRSEEGAVLSEQAMLAQVEQLLKHSTVVTHTGNTLNIVADTLCVHGDNLAAIAMIEKINALCQLART